MLPFSIRCSARAMQFSARPSFRSFTTTPSRSKSVPKLPPKTVTPSQTTTGRPQQIQTIASRILDAGRNEIYRNTASNGFVLASAGVVLLSLGNIFWIFSTRLWNEKESKKRGLPWFVPVANNLGMIMWGFFGMFALSRTFGIVKSMKLVRVKDRVLLETSIRRPIPFTKPEKHLSDPHTLVINRAKLFGAVNTEGMIVASESASFVSRFARTLFYTPFHSLRKLFGTVGLVPVQVGPKGELRFLRLDADGQFSNEGQDLLNLAEDE